MISCHHTDRHTISLGVLLCVVLTVCASVFASPGQSPDTVSSLPGIEVTTSVDHAEVYVGDLITYTLAITHDTSAHLVPPPIGANLGAFDVKDYQADVETKLPGGRIESKTTFVLSTFTTGDYIIPPLPILFDLPGGAGKVLMAEAVPIKVLSLLTNTGDSVDIHPLKDPYEFKRSLTPYIILGAAALILIVALIIVWLRLRRKKGAAEVIDLRPPWEIALEKLAMLKEKRLVEQEEHKEYYIELTEIIRVFLGRAYHVSVVDMTTEEFIFQFSDMLLPEKLLPTTTAFLRHADLVKFAKHIPDVERSESEYLVAYDIIQAVRRDIESQQPTMTSSQVEVETVGGGTR